VIDQELEERAMVSKPRKAGRHPYRYQAHKYWGRKPANIVSFYISSFTREGDVVLDLFGGSGVTAIEALILGRRAINIDINPIACFIAEQTAVAPVDISMLQRAWARIRENMEPIIKRFYTTTCPHCGNSQAKVVSTIWENRDPMYVYYRCAHCGSKGRKSVTSAEREQIVEFNSHPVAIPPRLMIRLPANSDAETVSDLFTTRNLIILLALYKEINRIDHTSTRNLLKFAFTSNLAFASKLMPVHKKRLARGKVATGIWGVKRYWIPSLRAENNPVHYFDNRLMRLCRAKTETNDLIGSRYNHRNFRNIVASDSCFAEIESGSVDFIFTDPPFGSSIPYGNLSLMWNAWLGLPDNRKAEIIIGEGKSLRDYEDGLKQVFAEAHRVLRDGKAMCVAFNNRDFDVWRAFLASCLYPGFELKRIDFQEEAEGSFTQHTQQKKSALIGHFIYVFRKSKGAQGGLRASPATNFEDEVKKLLHSVIRTDEGLTISQVYKEIVPYLVNSGLIFRERDYNRKFQQILEQNFVCKRVVVGKKMVEGFALEEQTFKWYPKS